MTPSDIKAWREAMRYTHRPAAEALGVQLVSYQRMERGAWSHCLQPVASRRMIPPICKNALMARWLPDYKERTKKLYEYPREFI